MGIDWNAEDFLAAIERGDRRAVELFFSGGMRPDVRTDKSVLFYVIARGAPDIRWTLSKFIDAGLDVNEPMRLSSSSRSVYVNDNWRTPLFVAALNENYVALEYLLEVGAERKYAIIEAQ